MKEVGYFCPECNVVYSYCWEFENSIICSHCFCENIKIIDIDNIRNYISKFKLRNNSLSLLKNNNFFNNSFNNLTVKNKEFLINIINKKIRKDKLKKLFKNE